MDNESAATVPDTNTETNYGNMEITLENATQEQLEQLLEFIVAEVEEMGLFMVARTFMTTEDDYKEEDLGDAQESESTSEG